MIENSVVDMGHVMVSGILDDTFEDVEDGEHSPIVEDEHICGTVACHAGWYAASYMKGNLRHSGSEVETLELDDYDMAKNRRFRR